MRIIGILALALILGACMGKEKKEMVNEFEDLMVRYEKNEQHHRLIYQKEKEMLDYHDELMKFLNEADNVPDSIMEGMKNHETFFSDFRSTLAKHKAIMDEHDVYHKSFNKRKVKKDELRLKLDAMIAEHEAMEADHEYVKDKMAEIRSEHNQYRKWYNNAVAKK